MIFAAGFGRRMGALTADRPKPLLEALGKPLIDHAIELGRAAGVDRIVSNAHYRADLLVPHLEAKGIAVSHERSRILDTGGGLKQARPMLGSGPVFTLNSDAVWTGTNPLDTLAAAWRPGMQALLLLVPQPDSDFAIGPDARLTRKGGWRYTGAQIIDAAVLDEIDEEVFSLNRAWDVIAACGGLFGCIHAGGWCDVGRPEGLEEARALVGAEF